MLPAKTNFPEAFRVLTTGYKCRVANLEKLIALKRAAGRVKDSEVIAELQALLEERQRFGR